MTLHKNISKKYEDFDTPSIDDKRIERLTGRIKRVSQEMKNRYSFKWIG